MICHGLDTEKQVFFYENEFYVLSNFSAFQVWWGGKAFPTSEHAYQWAKFDNDSIKRAILTAPSAHEAMELAKLHAGKVVSDWEFAREGIMQSILQCKVEQHEYVWRKLLETGTRELVENSWRDSFWGCGPDKTGRNTLGKLWMGIREVIRNQCLERVFSSRVCEMGTKSCVIEHSKYTR